MAVEKWWSSEDQKSAWDSLNYERLRVNKLACSPNHLGGQSLKFRFLQKNRFWRQIYIFWRKLWFFLQTISILTKHFDFLRNISILTKISIFYEQFRFFYEKFLFVTKRNSIFTNHQKLHFLRKISILWKFRFLSWFKMNINVICFWFVRR